MMKSKVFIATSIGMFLISLPASTSGAEEAFHNPESNPINPNYPILTLIYTPSKGTDFSLFTSSIDVILHCLPDGLSLHVRGFEPAQAFPQPDISVTSGKIELRAQPYAVMIGDEAALNASFYLTKDAINLKKVVESIPMGLPIGVEFGPAVKSYYPARNSDLKRFSAKCLEVWQLP